MASKCDGCGNETPWVIQTDADAVPGFHGGQWCETCFEKMKAEAYPDRVEVRKLRAEVERQTSLAESRLHAAVVAEETAERFRLALVGLVGESDPVRLEAMAAMISVAPIPEQDKANTINAIHALMFPKRLEAKA